MTSQPTQVGYIYLLIRSDFIKNNRYIFKIGKTTRNPPHIRLWEYPHGSLFLTLIKTLSTTLFEKQLINQLRNTPNIKWEKDIGEEYFSGDPQIMINIMKTLHTQYPADISNIDNGNCLDNFGNINELFILKLNRIHYIPDFNQSYFNKIFNCQYFVLMDNITSECIYKSYHKARSWHQDWPENYVIRCGMSPIKPKYNTKNKFNIQKK